MFRMLHVAVARSCCNDNVPCCVQYFLFCRERHISTDKKRKWTAIVILIGNCGLCPGSFKVIRGKNRKAGNRLIHDIGQFYGFLCISSFSGDRLSCGFSAMCTRVVGDSSYYASLCSRAVTFCCDHVTFNRWRTVVSATWKYDYPRLNMSHEGAARVWHVQPRVVIFPCRTNYRVSYVLSSVQLQESWIICSLSWNHFRLCICMI